MRVPGLGGSAGGTGHDGLPEAGTGRVPRSRDLRLGRGGTRRRTGDRFARRVVPGGRCRRPGRPGGGATPLAGDARCRPGGLRPGQPHGGPRRGGVDAARCRRHGRGGRGRAAGRPLHRAPDARRAGRVAAVRDRRGRGDHRRSADLGGLPDLPGRILLEHARPRRPLARRLGAAAGPTGPAGTTIPSGGPRARCRARRTVRDAGDGDVADPGPRAPHPGLRSPPGARVGGGQVHRLDRRRGAGGLRRRHLPAHPARQRTVLRPGRQHAEQHALRPALHRLRGAHRPAAGHRDGAARAGGGPPERQRADVPTQLHRVADPDRAPHPAARRDDVRRVQPGHRGAAAATRWTTWSTGP